MIHFSRKNRTELLWFVVSGALTAALYLVMFSFLYQLLGLPEVIALPCAYTLAVTLHIYLNSRLTFSSTGPLRGEVIFRYAVFSLASFLAQSSLVYLITWSLGVGLTEAVAFAALAVPIASFLTMKIWVFRKASS